KQLRFPIRLGRLGLELRTRSRAAAFSSALNPLDAVSVALVRFARFCVVLVAVFVGAILCAPVRDLTRTILSLLPQWLATLVRVRALANGSEVASPRASPPARRRPGLSCPRRRCSRACVARRWEKIRPSRDGGRRQAGPRSTAARSRRGYRPPLRGDAHVRAPVRSG